MGSQDSHCWYQCDAIMGKGTTVIPAATGFQGGLKREAAHEGLADAPQPQALSERSLSYLIPANSIANVDSPQRAPRAHRLASGTKGAIRLKRGDIAREDAIQSGGLVVVGGWGRKGRAERIRITCPRRCRQCTRRSGLLPRGLWRPRAGRPPARKVGRHSPVCIPDCVGRRASSTQGAASVDSQKGFQHEKGKAVGH